MPTPALAAMAKNAGVSLADAERYWDDAKKLAKDQGRANDYAYIMGIVKKRMGYGKNEWDYPMDVHFQKGSTTTCPRCVGRVSGTTGFCMKCQSDQHFGALSCTPTHEKPMRVMAKNGEKGYAYRLPYSPTSTSMRYRVKWDNGTETPYMPTGTKVIPDTHNEEITTTVSLGVGSHVARTSPENAAFMCASCGLGSDKDEGGTCPKCGGRMTARESWIRELIAQVEAGEAPHKVLASLLK